MNKAVFFGGYLSKLIEALQRKKYRLDEMDQPYLGERDGTVLMLFSEEPPMFEVTFRLVDDLLEGLPHSTLKVAASAKRMMSCIFVIIIYFIKWLLFTPLIH